MYQELKERIRPEWIGHRDETYPTGISQGYPGYSYAEAEKQKQNQINMMKVASSTLDIIVVIEPLHGKKQEGTYCVRNKSTYIK